LTGEGKPFAIAPQRWLARADDRAVGNDALAVDRFERSQTQLTDGDGRRLERRAAVGARLRQGFERSRCRFQGRKRYCRCHTSCSPAPVTQTSRSQKGRGTRGLFSKLFNVAAIGRNSPRVSVVTPC